MAESERGEGDFAGWIILAILGLAVWGGISLYREWSSGGWEEHAGLVKFEDCREIFTINLDAAKKLGKSFTCASQRTWKGTLMGGKCAHVETSNGLCTKAYVYDQNPTVTCQDKTPWLGYDDLCYATWDTGRVFAGPSSR